MHSGVGTSGRPVFMTGRSFFAWTGTATVIKEHKTLKDEEVLFCD